MQMYLEFAEESLRLREKQLDQKWRDRKWRYQKWPDQNGHYVGQLATIPDAAAADSEDEALSPEGRLALAKEDEWQLSAEFNEEIEKFEELFDTSQLYEMETAGLRQKREVLEAVRQRLDKMRTERRLPAAISIFSRASALPKHHNGRWILCAGIVLGLYLVVGRVIGFLQRRHFRGRRRVISNA
jgi:hypothetical protein